MLYEVTDMGDSDERRRAIALMAAATVCNDKSGMVVLRMAQQFESYLKTGVVGR